MEKNWENKVQEITSQIESLYIPSDPSPSTLIALQSNLDRLQTSLSLEHTLLKAELSSLKEQLKVRSKILYLEVKDQAKTEKEREALVYKRLMEDFRYGEYDVFTAVSILEGQVAFLETALSLISSKTQRLITILGSMKLEQAIISADQAVSSNVSKMARTA